MVHLILITTALVATTGFFGTLSYSIGYNHIKLGNPISFILWGINIIVLLRVLHFIESFI